jgi:glycosyltransferase involved in cell wall biosynthesis
MAETIPSSKPVQVLLVADDDAFDRLGSIVQHLCIGLMDEPVKLTVLLRSRRTDLPDSLGPARLVRLWARRWPRRPQSPEVTLAKLEGQRPDVVHALSVSLSEWVRQLSISWKCQLVMHITDLTDVRDLRRVPEEQLLAGITATSHLHDAVLARWPRLRDRLWVIPFGVPAQNEPACEVDPQRVPAVLVTTPLTPDCGLDGVLRALHAIIRTGQEAQLFVLSGGKAERGFRRLVDHLDLRSWVTFSGPMRDGAALQSAMLGADFFIEPNPNRRFSSHPLNAMAAGLAILAPQGTLEDYLVDGATACLFDPDRPEDLTSKWGGLLRETDTARALASRALEYARTHHQASTMVQAFATAYRRFCGSPEPAGSVEAL